MRSCRKGGWPGGWGAGSPLVCGRLAAYGVVRRRAWRDRVTETHRHAAAYWGRTWVILRIGTRLLTAWARNLGFELIPYLGVL